MGKVLLLITLFTVSCGVPPARMGEKLPYTGYLHLNTCHEGATMLSYQKVKYPIGANSTQELSEFATAVKNGAAGFAEPVGEASCEKVYRIQFSGDFEKEKSFTSYNGEQTRQVVQIYSFKFL